MAFWRRASDQKDSHPPEPADDPIRAVSPSGAVVVRDTTVQVEITSIAGARIALKECRSMKKELQLEKKSVNAEISALKARRRDQLARQGGMTRGRGTLPRMMREMEHWSRQSDRSKHADALAPLEAVKQKIDIRLSTFDDVMLQIEQTIHQLEIDGHEDRQPGVRCGYCDAKLEHNARFCGSCGAPT